MASIENQLLLIAYVTLAAVIAMIYGMRRIFILEKKIVRLERAIIGKKGTKKKTKKRKKKK
tara:strand:- start:247 stop:429 length:183 start_codon:yes stop_codon:yes gene_type:complete